MFSKSCARFFTQYFSQQFFFNEIRFKHGINWENITNENCRSRILLDSVLDCVSGSCCMSSIWLLWRGSVIDCSEFVEEIVHGISLFSRELIL